MKHRRAGFSLIELLVVLAILAVMLGLLLSAIQKARDAAARLACSNNLRQVGLALHMHHEMSGAFPPGLRDDAAPGSYYFLSWHARLLPFIEQDALWRSTLDAYQAEPNPFGSSLHTAGGHVVPSYGCPADDRTKVVYRKGDRTVCLTSYMGVQGVDRDARDGVLFLNSSVSILHISDGTSNTLLVGERPPSRDLRFGWWYAGIGFGYTGTADMVLGASEVNKSAGDPDTPYGKCPAGPYSFAPGGIHDDCSVFRFWSTHAGGANFAFADGSVRFLSYGTKDILPALATRAGGEPVAP